MVRIIALVLLLVSGGWNLSAADGEKTTRVRYITPSPYTGISPVKLAFYDFIPGYGMFHHGRYGWAAFYAGMKIAGAAAIFVGYRNWQFWDSAAASANSFQSHEPGTVFFKDPTGGSEPLTARQIQNRADSGYLLFLYAIGFEILIHGISFYHTWSATEAVREQSEPYYQVEPEDKTSFFGGDPGFLVSAGWRRHF